MQLVPHRISVYGVAALMGLGTTRAAAAQTAAPTLLSDASAVTEVETLHRASTKTQAATLSAEAVRVPGFWDFRESPQRAPRAGWVWVPGTWLQPPVPRAPRT